MSSPTSPPALTTTTSITAGPPEATDVDKKNRIARGVTVSVDGSSNPSRSDDDLGNIGVNPSHDNQSEAAVVAIGLQQIEAQNVHWYSYMTTLDFWIVLAIGQVLALCITATNTFTTLLSNEGTSIPAFQTLFNYVLLTLIFLTIALIRYGPVKYLGIVWCDGWKYAILSFLDVLGNYFTVLAYRYTNIMSAQLLNFWAIVCVVAVSFFFLRVRYRLFQIAGIIICCGGMGILLTSDHIAGSNGGTGQNMLKGDLFGLAGATFYGLCNIFEEWLVSRRPTYEVLSFIGAFGIIINGVIVAIFDRNQFKSAAWNGQVAGYLVGYTLCLTLFYSVVPLILRMASAAFFNVSLLTGNFWGVVIGIHIFGYAIHFLYPIAFVLIIIGLIIYFLAGSALGDSKKPWLGDNQEDGVAGFGTAKLKALNAARKAGVQSAGVV